jgi:hypothetical protein
MFRIRVISTTLLTAALLSPLQSWAKMPIRDASGNGVDSNAASWNLSARVAPKLLTAGTKKATFTRQTVCLNADVEDSLPSPVVAATGTCDSGVYLNMFQFISASTSVKVTIGQLVGADPIVNPNDFGFMVCDGSGINTNQLCTFDPNDPNGNNLPNVTVAASPNKTSVIFTVPSFPTYAPGGGNRGQGLTLYVITRQAAQSVPIHLSSVGIQ